MEVQVVVDGLLMDEGVDGVKNSRRPAQNSLALFSFHTKQAQWGH